MNFLKTIAFLVFTGVMLPAFTQNINWSPTAKAGEATNPIDFDFNASVATNFVHLAIGSLATSISDQDEKDYITLFPNLASDQLNVICFNTICPQNLKIFNRYGQVVLEQQGLFSNIIELDISQLIPDVYFLRLSDENEVFYTSTFVKIAFE